MSFVPTVSQMHDQDGRTNQVEVNMEKRKAKTEDRNKQVPQVIMYSDEYGFEDFDYDTVEEAEAGFERLKRDCAKAYKKDGIERRLLLVTAAWETEHDS